GKRTAREMEQVRFQMSGAPVHLDGFMDVFAHPARPFAIEQPHLAVRIPAGMQNPAAQILRQARNGITVVARAVFLDLPDLAFQRLAERFVGVDRKNPVVGGLLGGKIFLARIARPRIFQHARSEVRRQLHRTVVRPAVHHDDLIAATKALNSADDVALFVVSDDGGRDFDHWLLHYRKYARNNLKRSTRRIHLVETRTHATRADSIVYFYR